MSIAWISPTHVGRSVVGRLARLGACVALVAISLGCTDQSRLVEPPAPRLPPPDAVIPVYGTVVVRVVTSGEDIDPDGFVVEVDGPWAYEAGPAPVANNGTVTFTRISAGKHSLTLLGVAENCGGEGLVDRPIVIAPDVVTTISFQLVCTRRGISG